MRDVLLHAIKGNSCKIGNWFCNCWYWMKCAAVMEKCVSKCEKIFQRKHFDCSVVNWAPISARSTSKKGEKRKDLLEPSS